MLVIALIRIMLAYSPRKNRANAMLLYSTKKPATISLSPSGRSNGARLVSASAEMKNTTNIGNSGMQNQIRLLRQDDVGQVQAADAEQHRDQHEAHRDLVADHLRRRAHARRGRRISSCSPSPR